MSMSYTVGEESPCQVRGNERSIELEVACHECLSISDIDAVQIGILHTIYRTLHKGDLCTVRKRIWCQIIFEIGLASNFI